MLSHKANNFSYLPYISAFSLQIWERHHPACCIFPSPRLRLERTQHYVEAFVERSNGNVVLSASTREWAIKKHLYSPTGVTACRNLGRVMAQRCLEAGINFVNFKAVIPWEHRCDSASTCLLILDLPFFPLSKHRSVFLHHQCILMWLDSPKGNLDKLHALRLQ